MNFKVHKRNNSHVAQNERVTKFENWGQKLTNSEKQLQVWPFFHDSRERFILNYSSKLEKWKKVHSPYVNLKSFLDVS